MTAVTLPDEQFAGVAAFYSLNHVPRTLYPAVLRRIHGWLRPGGVFVGNFSAADEAGWTGDWLGAPTFFSGYEAGETLALVQAAGLEPETHAVEADDGGQAEFLWVVARRTAA